MAKCWIVAGRLLWRDVRSLVELARAEGHKLRLWESSGWLEREFIAFGDNAGVLRVKALWDERFQPLAKAA